MDEQELRKSLEEIHVALLAMGPLDAARQEEVDKFAVYLRDILANEDLSDYEGTLAGFLEDNVEAWETNHPRLAQIVSETLHLLNSIGM